MQKVFAFSSVTAIVVSIAGMGQTSWAKSVTLKDSNRDRADKIAQLYYPPVSDRQGIQVFGQGQVKLPADKAILEFSFGREAPPAPAPTPGEGDTSFPLPPPPKPIVRTDLQPVVDAIAALGVPSQDIKVKLDATSLISLSSTKPQITFEIEKPTRSRVERIVEGVKEAAREKAKLTVDAVNVGYATKDCQKLTSTAYDAAVRDAKSRAEAIASSLKVKLKAVPTVSESFFYDIFVPLCVTESGESLPLPWGYGNFRLLPPYNPDTPAEVQLRRDLFVTYPVED